MTESEYKKLFDESDKQEKALEYALDIRKFEIELYWKRATYFWTFIATALAGFAIVQKIDDTIIKGELSLLLTSLGMVFSLSWYLVNRGSKFWQNNWERHVDLLEDEIIGPLYKISIESKKMDIHNRWIKNLLTQPGRYSVTKINQILSFFVFLIWCLLYIKTINLIVWGWYSITLSFLVLCTIGFLLNWTKSDNSRANINILQR